MILKKIFTIMSALVLFLISVRTGYSGSVSLSRSWVTRGDGSEIPTETRGTKLTAVTADKFDFKINYYMDRSGSMTNTPLINARVVASTFIDSIPYDTSYSVMVDSVQSGRWAVEVKNLTHSSYDVSGMAVGTPQIFAEDYELGLSTSRAGGSQFVAVGAKERLVLRIQKDGYDLTGVQKIEGVVRDVKGGKVADIVFQDDGDIMRGDAEASDGLYSALATFPAPGSYTIEVQLDLDGAKLRKTYVGLLDAPRLGDSSSEEGDFGEEIDATFSPFSRLWRIALLKLRCSPSCCRRTQGW